VRDLPSESAPIERESLEVRLKLLGAQAVDIFATSARGGIGAVTNAVGPHPYKHHWGSTQVDVDATNLHIPGSAQVYLAPSMVLHYVSRHRYRPPDGFCDAVLRCPQIGTRPYFKALRSSVQDVATIDFGVWVDQQVELVRKIGSRRVENFGTMPLFSSIRFCQAR
jgi:hypothetical protein